MKHYTVSMIDRSQGEYATADAWWRTHRTMAPHALRDEIRTARRLLSGNPEAGIIDETQPGGIRRLLLPGVRYYVYYSIDHPAKHIRILSVWHTSRQSPEL